MVQLYKRDSPFIIPVFLPQWGCPYQCVYCRQEKITGVKKETLDFKTLSALVATGLASKRRKAGQEVEIAFYGGTFTAIEARMQEALLEWGGFYTGHGLVNGLRISTRPDGISHKIVKRLCEVGVKTVELGVQSLEAQVLKITGRGHTARHVFQAINLLKEWPVKIGAQIMLGLPGDDGQAFRETVERLQILKPDLVRIYPTLVFRDTVLARWYEEGRYRPLSLEEAIEMCHWAVEQLEGAGIPVIRLGIQHHQGLEPDRELLAGPHHPAFGDLVRKRIIHKQWEVAVREGERGL
jgi:histone acetyltransferase (RNA polymerase elongator complex component)